MSFPPLVPVVLEGSAVRLEPLTLAHLDPLCAIGLDPSIWTWMPKPVTTRDEMRTWIETALARQEAGEALPFAIVERSSGAVAGSTRFMEVSPPNRRLEIGWTWLGKAWQRTAVNTGAKYLLLRHAFETLGATRVEFKTDALNTASRRALARIGAHEEGTLRSHMVTASGRVRDSVYFSVIAAEWPDVKVALGARLSAPSPSR